jgi:hypothetical protein
MKQLSDSANRFAVMLPGRNEVARICQCLKLLMAFETSHGCQWADIMATGSTAGVARPPRTGSECEFTGGTARARG